MISCTVNFKDNLTKNIPYYKLLLKQINDVQGIPYSGDGFIGENAALYSSGSEVLSKICEGYQFIIAFDGELTDKAALTKELKALGYCFTAETDSELALLCYIHFGEKSPGKLSGCFSYVIYDTMRRQVFAASDFFASSPLFYAKTDNSYLFASQIRGILAHPDIKPTLSKEGVSRLLSQNGLYTGSIFNGIEMLPPAHFLKIRDGNIILKPYTLTDCETPTSQDLFISELSAACKNDGKTGVFNTGSSCDRLLCHIAAEIEAKKYSRISIYSTETLNLPKKYTAIHTHIIPSEGELRSSLAACVSVHGMPVFSGTDFLLPTVFKAAAENEIKLITQQPDLYSQKISLRSILIKNNVLHPAVEESLLPEESGFTYIGSRQIAGSFKADIKTPLLSRKLYQFIKLQEKPLEFFDALLKTCTGDTKTCTNYGLLTLKKLRRILLEIISSDSAPILAFFRKGALLSLCEKGVEDISNLQDETAFLAYIIKLNIWLCSFRPFIN